MAIFLSKPTVSIPRFQTQNLIDGGNHKNHHRTIKRRVLFAAVCALENKNPSYSPKSNSIITNSSSSSSSSNKRKQGVPVSNYVVPLAASAASSVSSCITRPLAEILRDLNKKIPDSTIKPNSNSIIPWYHANRMLSFYAPGWCGEIRDVIFSDNGTVTVVYRVTIRGSDGEAHRESTGTISSDDGHIKDPVAAAEEIAFCRACARFGLGLHLYHEDKTL